MPSHVEGQARFARALTTAEVPDGLGSEAEARFAVYRRNHLHGLTRALAQRFPVIEALLGAESFAALARLFIAAHPPASPLLFAWGGRLPEFLAARPELAAWPYLADVARLEWARGLAWHAADAAPVAPGLLATAAQRPEALRLCLHPSLQLVECRHAVVSIWAAHQPGGSLAGLDPGRPETALILRDPQDRIVTEPLARGDAALLRALAQGQTLLAALTDAGPGHDPTPLILRLVRHGAITAMKEDLP